MRNMSKKGFFYKMMILFERLTFATANYSIATNESYKEIAIRRGKIKEYSSGNKERPKIGPVKTADAG